MAKIDVNKVAEILKKNEISPAVLRRVMEELNLAAQPDPGDGEKPPPMKKQFVILISDPEGRLPKNDFAGWVLQIPESESVATTQERVFRAAYDWNTTKKGSLLPVKMVFRDAGSLDFEVPVVPLGASDPAERHLKH